MPPTLRLELLVSEDCLNYCLVPLDEVTMAWWRTCSREVPTRIELELELAGNKPDSALHMRDICAQACAAFGLGIVVDIDVVVLATPEMRERAEMHFARNGKLNAKLRAAAPS